MVDGETIGAIDGCTLLLLGVEKGDPQASAENLLKKVLAYHIFNDEQGKMNLSLNDTKGGLLNVSQLTLAASTTKGNRPGFSDAAAPDDALAVYHYFCDQAKAIHKDVATGEFGADMKVSLLNDGQ